MNDDELLLKYGGASSSAAAIIDIENDDDDDDNGALVTAAEAVENSENKSSSSSSLLPLLLYEEESGGGGGDNVNDEHDDGERAANETENPNEAGLSCATVDSLIKIDDNSETSNSSSDTVQLVEFDAASNEEATIPVEETALNGATKVDQDESRILVKPIADEGDTTSTVVTITTATSTLVQNSEEAPFVQLPILLPQIDDCVDAAIISGFVEDTADKSVPNGSLKLSDSVALPSLNQQILLLPPTSGKNNQQMQQRATWLPNVSGANQTHYMYPPPSSYYGQQPSGSRGPRHASGNSGLSAVGLASRVRGGSHLGFVGGGSERELSVELSKENIKRWSLAGTSPEIALLRVKLEDVQRELSDLRMKHESKLNDYQSVLHQLEFCQDSKSQLEVDVKSSRTEIMRLKNDYDRLLQQKQLLDRQVIDLQQKLQRKQGELDELLVGRPNTGDLTRKLMEEYEDLRVDREKLREKCRDVESECADVRQTLMMSREENSTMQIQYESELEAQRIKIESMEHRQMAIYQQLHKMAQDRDLLRTDREVLRQQWEESCANATRFQNILQKREEDLHVLQRKHDGVLAEYHRVMSERDSVLKENERLSEEKSNLVKKFKATESDRQALIEQLRTREIQVVNLQHERDDFCRKMNAAVVSNSRENLNLLMSSQGTLTGMVVSSGGGGGVDVTYTSGTSSEQRSIASSEDEVAMIMSRAQDEKVDEMRRRIDVLKEQFESSRQEIDSAKQQRDWALSERQRIVAERDSMRTMCDTLRRERDDAITKLAVAIRDTDELQRQKEQAEREVKKLKDRLDLDIKPKVSNQDSSPSHSRDSAIDTDMAEWEIETLELNMSGSQKTEDLGIELRGGRDDPIYGTTVPIYVKAITKGSKLDSVLKIYDCIMQVNNIDVANMDRRSVMDILKNSNSVKMVIKRRRLIGMKLISVPLDSNGDDDFGVFFEDGVYVTQIKTSSLAAKAGNLAVGDRLVYLNDIPVQGKTAAEIHTLVQNHKGCGLVLAVMKSPPILSPMTPSASLPGFNSSSVPSKTVSVNNSNGSSAFTPSFAKSMPKFRDEEAQTSSAADLVKEPPVYDFVAPKKESFIDKVHDRIFGKNEKKSTVRACASIPNENVDNQMKGSTAARWRVYPHSASERGSTNRYRASSVCSSVSSSASSCAVGKTTSDEQQVLSQLDSILENSEHEYTNKSLNKIMNGEKGGSGGTWPKSRPPPLMLSGNNVAEGILPNAKRSNDRRSVFPLALSSTNQPETENETSVVRPTTFHQPENFTRMRPTNIQTPKMRMHDTRPVSYHPTVSSPKYYNDLIPPNSPPAIRTPIDVPSNYYDNGSYVNVNSRPSSVQSARREKVVSSYEPLGYVHASGMEGQPAAMVTYKQNRQIVRATPVNPVHSRHSNYPSRHGLSPLYFTNVGSSTEQDFDSQSMTSQSSGMNRSGNRQAFYIQNPQKYPGMKTGSISPFTSIGSCDTSQTRLSQGEPRSVCIKKRNSHEGLGISIAGVNSGHGVYIACVNENSLAAKHGLQVGDQILEVCGLNLRTANSDMATNVLKQLHRSDQITFVVQYNPDRYLKEVTLDYGSASTPRATPNSFSSSGFNKQFLSRESSMQSTHTQHSRELLTNADCGSLCEPRCVFLKKGRSDWGFNLIGGNSIGIFVDGMKPDSPASGPEGLKDGDHLLEFDGANFRSLTLEQALLALERPCDSTVMILAQYNELKYQRCKAGVGDSFYVRVLVDRQAENIDELSYKAGDILRVDNTVFNGKPGSWRAWLVNQEGRERSCGIIPSKTRLEEEFLFKRSGSEISAGDGSSEGGGSRRGTIRRSLKFIRRSSRTSHQRTSSKDSRDLPDTDTIIADEVYQRVERSDEKKKRPVLILGALTDVFISKLLEDYPHLFGHCVPECVQPESISRLEQNISSNIYLDYRKRDKLFEITTLAAVKEIIDKGYHCILHVSATAIERLRRLSIYPIVVFVKFKHSKQIKELSADDRINGKQAKEMLETANQLEAKYNNMFSVVLQGTHNNVKYICQQIASAVEHEQKKTVWVVSNEQL